jgi:hypothetical protein
MEFVDPSLARGLVRGLVRRIKEKQSRVPTDHHDKQLVMHKLEILGGVPKKKREKHFIKGIELMSKVRPIIVLNIPDKNEGFGSFIELIVHGNYNEDQITFCPRIVDYDCKATSIYNDDYKVDEMIHKHGSIKIDSNHVLTRWLERDRIKDLSWALFNIGLTSQFSADAVMEAAPGDASLFLPNGGMLLGEVVVDEEAEKHYFKASTYLSSGMVKPHNLDFLINEEEVNIVSHWNTYKDDFMKESIYL